MDSTLRFEEVDQFLADPDPTVRLRTLNLLQEQWPSELLAHHQEKVTPLVADPRREVSSKALSLLQELMPSDRILQHLHTFFPWLKSADPWVKTSTRRLFEKKISGDVLSQHFQMIVPVLLADPQLQLWSFGLLRGKVSSEQLTGHLDLIMDHMAHHDWGVKRRTLEFIQEEMPREMGADQCQQIAPLLVHDDWEVRSWTLTLLSERLPSELLAQLAEKVIALAGDPRWEVQQQAVDLLEKKMPMELIIKHFQNLLARLQQADPRIRKSSLRVFEKRISNAILAEHFEKLVPLLLSDPELQLWALKFLKGRVSPKHLPELIDLIMLHLVSHKTWKKQKALELMKVHLPDELRACHIDRIEKLLVDTDCKVRIWTLELLDQRMPGKLLVQHWKTLWPLLDDESHKVQMAAAKLFIEKGSGLRREHVAEHCEQFAALLAKTGQIESVESAFQDILSPSPTKDKVARLLSKLPVSSFVAQHMEQIASWQDQSGNTWLHLAAAKGHLEACKALVDTAGLALRALNDAGEEPLSLAATREVDRFLRSRMHFQETRFGHGNAYHDMVKDERWVSEVVWYTVPLPGMAGHLGGMHSFLVITVSDADLTAAKRYVLEKAGSAAREAHQKNGVFVGTQGLETNLRSVPGVQAYKNLAKGNLQKELKVRKLYLEAHCTGQYDLASSNCHHAAQRVFNFCCIRHEDREVEPPNSWLAKLGATFQLTGLFNSSRSSSEGSGSRVGSAESQVASTSRPVDTPSGFTAAVDLGSDAFSEIAAALSHAVYEEETSGLLKPLEAEIAVIHNKLGKAVVVYDQATGSRHRVDPDERKSISIPKERATVDVYAVAWVPGLYTHRVLARKQPIWGGHIYSLTMDFRSVVVLQEVMPCACVSKVTSCYVEANQPKSGAVAPCAIRHCDLCELPGNR